MTSQPIPPVPPAALVGEELEDDKREDEHVDSDGTPVGEADRDADIIRSGGDPDDAE